MDFVRLGRLSAADSALLVIDVQDKLLAAIPGADALLRNVAFLIDAAKLLGVPVLATEQYPKGLGPTAACIAGRLTPGLPAKTAFSCAAVPEVVAAVEGGRPTVLVAGIESHVCVLQTVLDLSARGVRVFVAADAVASRFEADHRSALARMERAGAISTTVETAAFELLATAAHPAFKAVSRLVQDRARALRPETAT
jgi:nicotinamidase-related amidase